MSEDDWPRVDDQAGPRRAEDIGPTELTAALNALAGFSDNPWLVMQGQQLELIDNVLNGMEREVLRHMHDDDRPLETMALLTALSPMWIYAAYELLR